MSQAIPTVPMLIGGRWVESAARIECIDPYRQEPVASVCDSTLADLDAALDSVRRGAQSVAAMPARERARLLRSMASAVRAGAADLAQVMARETGKPVQDGLTEALRSAETLELSAEEAVRIEGAHIPMDSSAIGAGKLALTVRVPVGVVAAITPFNAPVNLTAHKLGPAFAAGNSVILKPSPQAAFTVQRFVALLLEGGLPPDWLALLHGDLVGPKLVGDPRVDFVSFTGSNRVGEIIKATSGLKRVALELGGNGFSIVASDADLALAAATCARNSMRLAGQSCISVQNVLVDRKVYDAFVERMVTEVGKLKVGDPLAAGTDVGPLISIQAAERVAALIDAAVEAGARLMLGGTREGALVMPTVLADVPQSCAAVSGEVFGPVVNLLPFDDVDAAFELANRGPFGLQAGIFTASLPLALRAAKTLRMGAVIVNGSSTWRSDQAPYGGVKASGIGREGPRFAIREMTDEKLIVFNH